ncbi:hypothetical protein [Texcoconibacillus texcoconensis]|uniref:Chromosomal replication initiation ATPase DnaA n=1 Tax=Texcoconibacillus texcoconensis TaxID=1095777 RepID=A0A840QSY3_9BACI|nr:hypothetical protein [Texcoconibacillus texcoconensis]MBB5174475.1 chromosomal replication initiation ATPase DnaA [Texcoconibacillus texcoconensis]
MNNNIAYHLEGHTSQGFYTLVPDLLKKTDHSLFLKGAPGTGVDRVLTSLVENEFKDVETHEIKSPDDAERLVGLYVPAYALFIYHDPLTAPISDQFPQLYGDTIDFNEVVNENKIKANRYQLHDHFVEMRHHQLKAYEHFSAAKRIHKEKEEIYLSAFDTYEADRIADEAIKRIFKEPRAPVEKPQYEVRFFGAATSKGPTHFINELTEGLSQRLIIKGRSGSGKSTLMKKVINHAYENREHVHVYFCALDPVSVDMVVLPDRGITMLDGTAPHVIDPTRREDEVVDMFDRCIDESVESEYVDTLSSINDRYKVDIKTATNHLKEMVNVYHEIKQIYQSAIEENVYNQKFNELKAHIQTIVQP